MAEALYRKYRSRQLSEVVGQEHITKTLANALKSGRISHAYLLTGPKGVGKTSVARILAHEVNGLPYKNDSVHMDIIEIDAASNRRIDEIRDLRDKVHIAPTSAKYKVYIIDEVHMLTKEAFNALLKTLEEPPNHVIFILATTEAHKLPETIISRTQRFTFKPIDQKDALKHLRKIAKTEGIDIDDESLALIAEHGVGSFRDSISILDQLGSNKNIKKQDVLELLGIVPQVQIDELERSLNSSSANKLLEILDSLRLNGYSAPQIAKQLSKKLRVKVIETANEEIIELLKNLLSVPASSEPEQLLELTLLEYQLKHRSPQREGDILPPVVEPEARSPVVQENTPKTLKSKKAHGEEWEKILSEVKSKHNTLYSILRMSEPSFTKDKLILGFQFPFHQKQITEQKNMAALRAIVGQYLPNIKTVECSVNSRSTDNSSKKASVNTISNIFGGAEVLE